LLEQVSKKQEPVVGHPGPYNVPHRVLIAEQDKKLQNLGSSIKNVFHVEADHLISQPSTSNGQRGKVTFGLKNI
jgi:hypothetical protein